MTSDGRFEKTLRVLERTNELLAARHVDTVVIGGMALAVHNYPRDTEDFPRLVHVALASSIPLTATSGLRAVDLHTLALTAQRS